MSLIEVKVPDIGDFSEVTVIELLVKPGDTIKAEQSLITVESDKASMEIPSSAAGVVKELRVQLGDKVKQGSVVLTLEVVGAVSESNSTPAQSQQAQAAIEKIAKTPTPSAAPVAAPAPDAAAPVGPIEVRVPDIGDFKDVAVIELLVKPGDTVTLIGFGEANNGPYGDALVQEVIPYLEKAFRCGGAGKRFTCGASTGGWVSLAWFRLRLAVRVPP